MEFFIKIGLAFALTQSSIKILKNFRFLRQILHKHGCRNDCEHSPNQIEIVEIII
jgi:hypothetical protein